MTRDERSLLLFLETQAVDHGGLVNVESMNDCDFEIARRWTQEGFIQFGRVASPSLRKATRIKNRSHWVLLSATAFAAAAQERYDRAQRMWSKRSWQTTEEKRGG